MNVYAQVVLLTVCIGSTLFGCKKQSIIPEATVQKASANPTNKPNLTSAQRQPESTPIHVHKRKAERVAMVKMQIMARGIEDKSVLEAMENVPRHLFIPRENRHIAYKDHPVPIGLKQTISQPYIVAYMTQALALKRAQRVLEIGTGSGYQAAVLAELVQDVYTIEIVAPLADSARETLQSLGYRNIHFRTGDGYAGWPKAAPFDAIILTAAPPQIPQPLLHQLKVGGVMIAPVGDHIQELVRITRTTSGFQRERVMLVRFVPMTGRAQEK